MSALTLTSDQNRPGEGSTRLWAGQEVFVSCPRRGPGVTRLWTYLMRPGALVAQDLFGPTNEAFAASDTDSCLERQTPFAPNHIGESDADASVLFVPKGKASLKEYDVSLPLTICHTLEPCHNGQVRCTTPERCLIQRWEADRKPARSCTLLCLTILYENFLLLFTTLMGEIFCDSSHCRHTSGAQRNAPCPIP